MQLTDKGERLKQKLLKQGFAEDELEVLFKTEEEMFDFYTKYTAAKNAVAVPDEEEGPEPEDDFRLSPEQERAVMSSKKESDEFAARERFAKHAAKTAKKKAPEVAPAEEKAEEVTKEKDENPDAPPVDFDDFLKSLGDGMSADDSNVPNN